MIRGKEKFSLIIIVLLSTLLIGIRVKGQTGLNMPIIQSADDEDPNPVVFHKSIKTKHWVQMKLHKNKFPVPKPEKALVKKLKEIDISRDTNYSFSRINIKEVVTQAGQPEIVTAKPPSSKIDAKYNIKYLNESHGLTSASILNMFMDSNDIVWIALREGGVIRYDGEYFAIYNHKNGFTDKRIKKMIEDQFGNIWFMGSKQLFLAIKFNGTTFTHYLYEKKTYETTDILEIQNGDIYFLTDAGIISYNGSEFRKGLKKEQYLLDIIYDTDSSLWISSLNNIYKLKKNNLTIYHQSLGLSNKGRLDINSDKNGIIWFSVNTNYKLNTNIFGYIKQDTITYYKNVPPLAGKLIFDIQAGVNDDIWIGTSDGLVKFSEQHFTHISQHEGMTLEESNKLFIDNNNNVWAFHYLNGINIIANETFINIDHAGGFNDIEAIAGDKKGNVWLGTPNGLYKYSGDNKLYLTDIVPLPLIHINFIFEDSKSRLWVGTWGSGLYCYENGISKKYGVKRGEYVSGVFSSVNEQENGDLWFGTRWFGLYKYDGEKFHHFNIRSYKNDDHMAFKNNIYSSIIDNQGRIWFSTDEGIAIYKDGNFLDYSKKLDFNGGKPYSMKQDKEGIIWMGTLRRGMYIYNGQKLIKISGNDGIKSDKEYVGIAFTKQGEAWIATNKGLDYITSWQSNIPEGRSLNIYNFNRTDGLRGLNSYLDAIYVDGEDKLWCGTNNSLALKVKIPIDTISTPHLSLISVEVGNKLNELNKYLSEGKLKKNLERGKDDKHNINDIRFSTLSPFLSVPLGLEIPYKSDKIIIRYAARYWSAMHTIKYQVKLEGFDKHWSAQTSKTEIEYQALPPGQYTFKVRAVARSGKWSPTLEYQFKILHPWWQKWWAYLIYSITSFLLVAGIVQIRTRSLNKRNEELDRIVKKRTHELLEHKEELTAALEQLRKSQVNLVQSEKMASLGNLTAGVAHEINNPLNFINGGMHLISEVIEEIDSVISGDVKDEFDRAYEMLNEGLERATEIVKALMTFSNPEKSVLEFSDINVLIDNTLMFMKPKFGDDIIVSKDYKLKREVPVFKDKVHQILINLINNALYESKKSIKEPKLISVSTFEKENNAVLVISNTGRQIPNDDIKQIFDPFFTTKNPGEGSGLGLSICYTLVKEHKGEIFVKNIIDGVSFEILLPLNNS